MVFVHLVLGRLFCGLEPFDVETWAEQILVWPSLAACLGDSVNTLTK